MKSRVFIKIVLLLIFQQLSFLHAQTVWGPFSCTNEKSFKQQTIGGGQPTYYWGVPYDYGNNKNGTTVVISRSVWSFTMPNFPQGAYVTKVEFKYKNVTDQNGDFNILHIPQNYIDPTSTYEQFWNISQNANSLLTCPGTTPNTAYTYEVPGLAQIVRDAKDAGGTIIYLGIRANPEGGTLGNVVLSAFSSVEVIFTFDIRAKYTIKNSFETGQVKINTQPQNSGFTDKFLTGISINLEAMEPQNSGNYEYLWNDTEALNNKSEWHFKQLNGIPVPKSINQSYSHPSSISEDNSLLIANLRRNFKITRNDQTEFDGTSGVADVTRIVDGNSGTVPADPTKTVGSRTYTYAGWANGGNGSYTPQDNSTYPYNALYKTTHYSNQSSTFMNNNQNKVVKTVDGKMHLVYESMGKVWYERSTDNGTTWQIMNSGKPLTQYSSKNPAIAIEENSVVIVYLTNSTTDDRIGIVADYFDNGNKLFSSVVQSYEYADASLYDSFTYSPVVAFNIYSHRILVAWNEEGKVYYRYGYPVFSDNNFVWYNQPTEISTTISASKLSITGCKGWEVTPPANLYHLVWQENSSIYYTSFSLPTYDQIVRNNIENVSQGCGYSYNYSPSISLSTDNVVNVAWAAMPYYGSSTRKVMTRTRTSSWSSYFGQYGNTVNYPSVACYGTSSIIAWSEGNSSPYSNKFYKWGSLHTAATTGRDLQIYNTSTLQEMRIVSYSSATSPYSFAQSGDLYNLNKENPLAMRSGVQVVAAQEQTEFFFRIGDISFNGSNLGFKNINLNATNLSQNDLDYLMTSDVVNLSSADNLSYAIEYGATDTVKALSLLQNDKFISFNIELIDASNDAVLYTLNDVKFTGSSSLSLSPESYNIDLTGLTGKEIYFKVKIANNLNPVYYASEIKSDANVLGKSKAVTIDLSKTFVVKDYDLFQNYPNPFNPATTITYQLPKSGSVTLKIYDMLGKEVMTLVNEQKEMGRYTVQFDASSLASGMYVYQLRANDYTSTKKMLLLK